MRGVGQRVLREKASHLRVLSPIDDFANSHDHCLPAGACHRPTFRASTSRIAKGDLKPVGHVDALPVGRTTWHVLGICQSRTGEIRGKRHQVRTLQASLAEVWTQTFLATSLSFSARELSKVSRRIDQERGGRGEKHNGLESKDAHRTCSWDLGAE